MKATIGVSVGGDEPRHFEVRAAEDGTFQIEYLSAATFELSVLADGFPKHQVLSENSMVENEVRDLGHLILVAD